MYLDLNKREENVKNVNTKLTIHSDLHAHILKIVLKLQLHKKEVILAAHMKEAMIIHPFNLQLAWKMIDKIDPITCWKGNFQTSASELCKVAVRILLNPSSSAASERNWSTFSYINEKKRNRLTDERVFKLVYIYSNYKLKCP